jgi:hypothetical protein
VRELRPASTVFREDVLLHPRQTRDALSGPLNPIFESYQHLYNKHRRHATLSRERSSLKVTSSPQSRLFSIAQGPRMASAKETATVARCAAYAFSRSPLSSASRPLFGRS